MGFNRSGAKPDRTVTVGEALNLTSDEEELEAGPSQTDSEDDSETEVQGDVYEASEVEGVDTQATEEVGELESVQAAPSTTLSGESSTTQMARPGTEQIGDTDEMEAGAARSPSPVPTEIVPEAPKRVIPFERVIKPGIIARDYAFHPEPVRPAPMVFSILATYIWFQYNRWRAMKQMPRILLNAWQSAFIGCDIVYLIHFNWVKMKEISWLDAQDWLGEGLLYLYKNPRDVEIAYGAKRPSRRSQFVGQWFTRFDACKTFELNSLMKECPKRYKQYAKGRFEFHGPFGEAMHRYFPHEETAVFWPLYDYLLGKGPKPQLSETMEKIFKPILHCYDGSAGGRGRPYERPRDKGHEEPLEGTEPEHIKVDPDWLVMERTKVPAFCVYRKEEWKKRERALARQLRDLEEKVAEEAAAKATNKRKKGKSKNWTRKKSHKSSEKKTKEEEEEEETDIEEKAEVNNVETGPSRRTTRSMTKAAKSKTAQSPEDSAEVQKSKGGRKRRAKTDNAQTTQAERPVVRKKGKGKAKNRDSPVEPPVDTDRTEPVAVPRKDKGKGKDKALPESEPTTSAKRRRNEYELDSELDHDDVDIKPSEPGPSSRPIRRVRRRVQPPLEDSPSNIPEYEETDRSHNTQEACATLTRGTKRQRGLEAETGQPEGDGEVRTSKRIRLRESDAISSEVAEVAACDASTRNKEVTAEVMNTDTAEHAENAGPPTPLQHPIQQPPPAVQEVQVMQPQPQLQPQAQPAQPPHVPPVQGPQNPLPNFLRRRRRCEKILYYGRLIRPNW